MQCLDSSESLSPAHHAPWLYGFDFSRLPCAVTFELTWNKWKNSSTAAAAAGAALCRGLINYHIPLAQPKSNSKDEAKATRRLSCVCAGGTKYSKDLRHKLAQKTWDRNSNDVKDISDFLSPARACRQVLHTSYSNGNRLSSHMSFDALLWHCWQPTITMNENECELQMVRSEDLPQLPQLTEQAKMRPMTNCDLLILHATFTLAQAQLHAYLTSYSLSLSVFLSPRYYAKCQVDIDSRIVARPGPVNAMGYV